ncbi:MAG TPA: cytochrome d ubiquinol oxidase subunit II [Kofleriaceae bacterium]|nr:cytochrome d ubiquinol oxidase subunit II [Kofleriaceae bacterium]
MSGPADAVAAVMLGSLVLYALFGGADFGGGVWDLFAFGPRASQQRALIEQAIAPIWEANHVWLILVVVLLFTAFPAAYSAATTALHVPLTLMLLGIVARGSAFVFRQYSPPSATLRRRWGRVFAISSTVTPLFLGIVIGAITAGTVRFSDGLPVGGFVRPWLAPFPIAVGLVALALFAFLAAVYLTSEPGDVEVTEDFRRRALIAGLAVGLAAVASVITLGNAGAHFRAALFGSWWSWPLQLATALAATSAFAALWLRRYRLARVCAIAQVSLIVAGWGLAQRPYLIAPDVTLANAAAPAATLRLLLIVLGIGIVILFPCLAWLYRVFKSSRSG